jgi:hypothetical protein
MLNAFQIGFIIWFPCLKTKNNINNKHDGLGLFKTVIEDQITAVNQRIDIYEFEPHGLLKKGLWCM